MAEADRAYRAAPADALVSYPLGALTALYHRPSRQTHIVDSPVPEILAVLAGGPLDVEGVLNALSDVFDLGDAPAARTALAGHLAELADLGLVAAA